MIPICHLTFMALCFHHHSVFYRVKVLLVCENFWPNHFSKIMPVRGPSLSKLEENFVLKALSDGIRLDQREMTSYRPIEVLFGIDYGCCTVSMGDTKVMSQVACVMDRPRESRPSEGRLNVHVEMSTIAFPSFDPSKPGELGIAVQRMLERSILLSRAVDLEELCVRVGEKAWTIQLYVHVLSHDGNIVDCAFLAAIAALKHFKHPDVSVVGQDVIVHTMEEKNPIPLTLHHLPLCTSFAFFKGCECMAIDPTYVEEKVMDGMMMISMNKHKEICSLQMSGQMQITKEQILRCTNLAALKAKELTLFIIKSLETDAAEKKYGKTRSCTKQEVDKKLDFKSSCVSNEQHSEKLEIDKLSVNDNPSPEQKEDNNSSVTTAPYWITKLGSKTASIGEGKVNSWADTTISSGEMGIFNDLRKTIKTEKDVEEEDDEEIVP